MNTCPTPDIIVLQIEKRSLQQNYDGHVCHYERCRVVNLPVEIHVYNNLFYIVVKKFLTPRDYHAQGIPLHPKNTLHTRLLNFYCCTTTGKVHYCHAECCGEKIYSSESVETCTISGMQFESEQVRNYGVTSRIQNNAAADKSDPLKWSRDENGRVIKTSGVHNTREEQCKEVAKEIIHLLLFSDTRLNSERNKLTDLQRDGTKKIQKYVRTMEKSKQVCNYLHMVMIYENETKKKPVRLDMLRKTPREQNDIIAMYTREIIGYWKMILFKTQMGMNSPSQYNFKAFVPAMLYIMKRGVYIGNQPIIRKAEFLNACLPETNTLDLYNISKTPCTATRNNIQDAIRETTSGCVVKAKQLYEYSKHEAGKVSF